MVARPCMLIVDPLSECNEVLRTVFEQRGLRVVEAANSQEGLAMARSIHPQVIVLDLESEQIDSPEIAENFRSSGDGSPPSLVILGSARQLRILPDPTSESDERIAKPYQYAPLIRKIESLLAAA